MIISFAFSVLITCWNNLLHLLPARARSAIVTSGVAVSGTAGFVWMLTHDAISLSSGVAAAARIGLLAALVGILAVAAFRFVPALAASLRDSRITLMSTTEYLLHTLIRIPMVSGLAEEVLFRGVMWWVVSGIAGPTWTLWATSVAFGAWHVVPSAQQARRLDVGVERWVVMTVLATSLAGVGFGWLRLVTGGVWAPAIVHAVINVVASVGARIASGSKLDAAARISRPATGDGTPIR